MLLVSKIQESIKIKPTDTQDDDLLSRVNQVRSTIPAVTHVDYSARVQTVTERNYRDLHKLLEEFYQVTGCAVLVNTSFNVRGEPIVCTPEDSYKCFMRTNMDILVLEDCILYKKDNIHNKLQDNWEEIYELD
jgi:carbamoyltransferase